LQLTWRQVAITAYAVQYLRRMAVKGELPKQFHTSEIELRQLGRILNEAITSKGCAKCSDAVNLHMSME